MTDYIAVKKKIPDSCTLQTKIREYDFLVSTGQLRLPLIYSR